MKLEFIQGKTSTSVLNVSKRRQMSHFSTEFIQRRENKFNFRYEFFSKEEAVFQSVLHFLKKRRKLHFCSGFPREIVKKVYFLNLFQRREKNYTLVLNLVKQHLLSKNQ